MPLMGQKSENSTVESSEKTVSPQKSSTVEEKESQNSDTEQTTALEENQMLERKKDGEHLEIAEKKDGVISDSGKAELESKLQSEPKAVEPPEPDVNDVKIPDSADELQGKEISEVGPAENSDTLEIKSEAPRVDEVEAASILHNESHNVFHAGSIDERETQAEETVEQSSIQAEASSDTQAEASDDVLAEASSDNRAEASSETQAEAAVDSSSSQPIISAEVSDMACELSLSTAFPSGEASKMVSGSVSKVDDDNDQTVGGDEGVNYGKVGSKEQHLSSGLNISDSIDSMLELEKLKTEIKMMETALQGAARQAQVLLHCTDILCWKKILQTEPHDASLLLFSKLDCIISLCWAKHSILVFTELFTVYIPPSKYTGTSLLIFLEYFTGRFNILIFVIAL